LEAEICANGSFKPNEHCVRHPMQDSILSSNGPKASFIAVVGFGGSLDKICKHQVYLPFAHFDQLGTKPASSERTNVYSQNRQ